MEICSVIVLCVVSRKKLVFFTIINGSNIYMFYRNDYSSGGQTVMTIHICVCVFVCECV